MLLTGDLSMTVMFRYFVAVVGGVLLPAVLLSENALAAGGSFHPLFICVAAGLTWLTLLIGELSERYLFFTAVAAPKMPGTA